MSCPRIIGVAGPSCAGKSVFAEALAVCLPGSSLLAMDRYYRDCSDLSEDECARQNFDHPNAIEWALLEQDVGALENGIEIAMPVYDFSRHARCIETDPCRACGAIVVEGIFALYSPVMRARYDLAIFIDVPRDIGRARRLERDVATRGRTAESVMEQLTTRVEPMYDRYVAPTRAHADMVLDGTRPVEELVATAIAAFRNGVE